MSVARIGSVRLWQVLDSRGNPTIACRVTSTTGTSASAIAPCGASTGSHEAAFVRDGGPAFSGLAVQAHLARVEPSLAAAVTGCPVEDPWELTRRVRELDPDPLLRQVGGHAATAVSIATWLLASRLRDVAPYEVVAEWMGCSGPSIPLPMVNIVSGGAHAGGAVGIQDVLAVPVGAGSFREAIELVWLARSGTAAQLERLGFSTALVADEGGLAAALGSDTAAIRAVADGIEQQGLSGRVGIALDVAASDSLAGGRYRMDGSALDATELVARHAAWADEFPLLSLEDPAAEDDDEGWTLHAAALPGVQIVGDDRYATTLARVQAGIAAHEADAVLVKVNQAGTLADALDVVRAARSAGWSVVVSARSGDTEESWLADLAVGSGADQIKVGSTTRSERTSKWNRLLELEALDALPFVTPLPLPRSAPR